MIEDVAVEGVEGPQDLLGTIVIPKCGRDKGRPCVLFGWADDEIALITDGRRRKVAKLKRKKMKHLVFTKYRHGEIYLGLISGGQVTDRMVREGLAAFGEQTGEGRQYG